MQQNAWWIPVGSFVLALVISITCGSVPLKLLARDPGGATGDCTPVVPADKAKKKLDCGKFKKTTKNFTPGKPDPEGFPGLKPGEDAVTECGMAPGYDVKTNIYTCTNNDGTCVAVSKATSIHGTFQGSATIWLPQPGSTPMLEAHEEGHATICEAACEACCKKLKKAIDNAPEQSAPQKSSDCASAKEAADAALKAAIKDFLVNEVQGCLDKEDTASGDYDHATDSGQKGDQKKEAKKYADAASDDISGKK